MLDFSGSKNLRKWHIWRKKFGRVFRYELIRKMRTTVTPEGRGLMTHVCTKKNWKKSHKSQKGRLTPKACYKFQKSRFTEEEFQNKKMKKYFGVKHRGDSVGFWSMSQISKIAFCRRVFFVRKNTKIFWRQASRRRCWVFKHVTNFQNRVLPKKKCRKNIKKTTKKMPQHREETCPQPTKSRFRTTHFAWRSRRHNAFCRKWKMKIRQLERHTRGSTVMPTPSRRSLK